MRQYKKKGSSSNRKSPFHYLFLQMLFHIYAVRTGHILPFSATAGKCRTFCPFALTGIAAFYADLTCMALAAFIIHTFCRLTIYAGTVRRGFHTVCIAASFFSLLETVAASLPGGFRAVSSDLYFVQVT